MKLLITGAGGQLGRELIRSAEAQGLTTIALPRANLDISDANAVQRKLLSEKADLVINAAAFNNVDLAETQSAQAFAVNAQGAANLANSCKACNIPLFHISSDFVYSGDIDQSNNETSPTNPINLYGKSKLEGDNLIQSILPKHIILRTAWVFSELGDNFVKRILLAAKNHHELRVVCDQRGNPTPAECLADTLIDLAARFNSTGELPWGLYNYAGSPAVTRMQFAQTILSTFSTLNNRDMPKVIAVKSSAYPQRAQRPQNSSLDCSKFEATFNTVIPDWKTRLKKINRYIDPQTHLSQSC